MATDKTTITSDGKFKMKSTSFLANRAVLLVLSSNFLGRSFVLEKKEILIGRGEGSDMLIDDPLVSKIHCKILFDDNKFYIEDLGSKNSTFLNGKVLKKRTQLIYGDRIIIGNTILRFYIEEFLEKQ